jgi:hypothetical protein
MTAVAITDPGVFIPASVAATIRYGLLRDLRAAQRAQEVIPAGVAEAVELLDQVGAWWDQQNRSDVSPDLSSVAAPPCVRIEWVSVKTASEELEVTHQAVTGLLRRGSLHGESQGRTWRVCPASVAARKEGTKCQH